MGKVCGPPQPPRAGAWNQRPQKPQPREGRREVAGGTIRRQQIIFEEPTRVTLPSVYGSVTDSSTWPRRTVPSVRLEIRTVRQARGA